MNRFEDFLARWLTNSGDMTFWSLVITVLYAIVIILSFIYTGMVRRDKQLHFLWMAISAFLLGMGINKQLDLQTLLIMTGKFISRTMSLRHYNRLIEISAALISALLLFIIFLIVILKTAKVLKRAKSALTGLAILILFLFIRIGSITGIRKAEILQHNISHIHGLELLGLIVMFSALTRYIIIEKKQLPI